MKSIARIARARMAVVGDLVQERILCGDVITEIKRDAENLLRQGKVYFSPKQVQPYPSSVLWYVLDKSGRAVILPKKYRSCLGMNFGAIFGDLNEKRPHHYLSIFTRRSVVGSAYSLSNNFKLIVERDLLDIMPTIKYFTRHPIFSKETIFVLSPTGRVIYHPDKNKITTRENLAFEMQDRDLPDKYGLFSYRYMNKDYLAMSMALQSPPDWQIFYTLPLNIARSYMKGPLSLHLSMIVVMSGLMFALLWFFLHRFFSRPVSKMVEAVENDRIDERKSTREITGGVRELEQIFQAIKHRDIAVSRAAEQLRAILDSMDASVYVADMNSHELLFVNDTIKQWAGDVVGQKCFRALHPGRTTPCSFCSNSELLDKRGQPMPVRIREYQDTLTGKWYECRDKAIPWTDGRLVRIEISTDISWRKTAERELYNEKERLSVTLKSIGDAVISTDTRDRITLMNPAAEKLTGWSSKEAKGRYFNEVVPLTKQDTGQKLESPARLSMDRGTIVSLERSCQLERKDGSFCIVSDSAAPIFDSENKITGAVVVLRDVTQELRTQKELMKIKKLETVGVLAGGIAHDFNNIITAILGNLELVQLKIPLEDKTHQQLENAVKACLRAQKLAQQLLTFSKGGSPVRKRTALPELIRESAEFILHGNKSVCRYDFPDDLWMADIDRGQISQVIQNLVLNSINAMPDGGEIRISCSNCSDTQLIKGLDIPPGHYIKITVSDSGRGIPAEIIDKIFEPYFSANSSGSGLGLTIVHSIISKHGGAITVESEEGRGATFSILLPASTQAEEKPFQKPGSQNTIREALILVMDDDSMIRAMARDVLNIHGHEVLEASHGKQAIEIYQQHMDSGRPVDVVIMDLTIPGGMGGREAAVKLLEMDPSATLVVASGYSSDPVMANYKEYGFKAALVKPYKLNDLVSIIAQLLSAKSEKGPVH